MIIHNTDRNFYYSDFINEPHLFSGFGTRKLGDSRDPEVIFSFLRINQVLFKKLVVLEQIHSVNVHSFTSENNAVLEKIQDTDGVVTADKGIVLVIRTADCLPVLYIDSDAGIIGASHNGWRGTLKQMMKQMIISMEKKGADRKRIKIAFGPSIGPCCYDVNEERYYTFCDELGYESKAFHFRGGKWHFNMLQLNYEQAIQNGINAEYIDFFPFCTFCNHKDFFSYRREYKKHPDMFGEQFSFIIQS